MRRIVSATIVLAGILLATPALANVYTIADGTRVTYYASHPLHDVEGVSTEASAEFSYDPAYPLDVTGLAETAIRVPWQSFDSGNKNRDANILDTVGAKRFPELIFVIENLELSERDEGVLSGTVTGRLYANGVRRDIEAPLTMDLNDPDDVTVTTSFSVNMTDFEMKPPRLLFVAAREEVDIEAHFRLVPAQETEESLAAE